MQLEMRVVQLKDVHVKLPRMKHLLLLGQFTFDGDSAASIGFERGQHTHSTIYVENLRDTRHLSESHRKLVKNVDFSKQMFPGINKKEQDRVRADFQWM